MAQSYSSIGQPIIRIASFAGTRPEAIKLAPVALAAKSRPHIQHRLIATGQQDALFKLALAEFGLSADAWLGHFPGGGPMEKQCEEIRNAVWRALLHNRPDIVLVQGDTNSALAAAEAAFELGIPVGHLEAGLRSHDITRPWPEEPNRVRIAQLASLHFAPSKAAVRNLHAEDVGGEIFQTGNTGIDALALMKGPSRRKNNTILITCHRRENFGKALNHIISAIRHIAEHTTAKIILPLHPNSQVRIPFSDALKGITNIALVDPLPYRTMIAAIQSAHFVISDSGGLQEECAALGVPLLLMRAETERPEVISHGNCHLVGNGHMAIAGEAMRLLREPAYRQSMARSYFPYGRGKASHHVLDAISLHFGRVWGMGHHHDTEMDTRQLAGPRRPPDAHLSGFGSA